MRKNTEKKLQISLNNNEIGVWMNVVQWKQVCDWTKIVDCDSRGKCDAIENENRIGTQNNQTNRRYLIVRLTKLYKSWEEIRCVRIH